MKYLSVLLVVFIGICYSCKPCCDAESQEKWMQEIKVAEKAFADMVAKEGLHKAFTAYAAEDAVIMRNNELVKGKAAIDNFYNGSDVTGLSWSPDYVDVSRCGELGYTYGQYKYSVVDSTGKISESKGVFHTVWKKQEDGSWKFVWD